jgi:predicted ribosome quality control (RQC) complex YloA/Tae2 family protein
MSTIDAITLAALAADLRAHCLGGRVQKVVHPDDLSLALEIYAHGRRHWLLASADPQAPRLHRLSAPPARTERVTPLLLLLRKYVRGRRLIGLEQPAFERVLHLVFGPPTADKESGPADLRLIIELIGRYSNIVLVGDGLVLEAIKRVPAAINRYRVILPKQPYVGPPAQAKEPPYPVAPATLAALLASQPTTPAWQTLVRGLAGLSPLLAREAVFRATGQADAPAAATDPAALARALTDLLRPLDEGQWQPSLAREGQDLVAFAPYPLTHLGTWEPVESISLAIERFYAQSRAVDRLGALRTALRARVEEARRQLERRREALQRELDQAAQATAWREAGELLLAYATTIAPGQTTLTLDDRTIPLDPALSPVENAQEYFRRYAKARDAARQVPALLAALDLEQAYLDHIAVLLETATTVEDLRALAADLSWRPGVPTTPTKKKSARPAPLRPVVEVDGCAIYVGRSNQQNARLTFDLAGPDDLWFHARGVPGAHVVLRAGGRPVTPRALTVAAGLAAYYSQARGESRVAVDYTLRKHVRRLPDAPPGLVTYSGEKTLLVRPLAPDDLQALSPAS